MNNEQSLSHTKWECKYHLTWIPKYRNKEMYGDLRKYLGEVFQARQYLGRRKNFAGQNFWARGFHVSTVGKDEEAIRKYIKQQEREDQKIDQLTLY